MTDSYTYKSDSGDPAEAEASEGTQFALATLRVKNIGDTVVIVPVPTTTIQFSEIYIRTDSRQFSLESYIGHNEYRGGEISTGTAEESVIMKEILKAANDFEITNDLTAIWTI